MPSAFQTLASTQETVADEALWSGLRALQEKEFILRRLAEEQSQEAPASAETVLREAEKLSAFIAGNTRDRAQAFLLSGLLRTPTGDRWYGNRTAKTEFYRVKTPAGSRNIPVAKVDSIVVDTVANDLASSAWAAEALKATQAMFAASHKEEIAAARAQIAALEARAARMVDMAAGLESPAPVLRRIY